LNPEVIPTRSLLASRPEALRRPPSSGGLPWQLRLATFVGLIVGAPFLFQTPVGQRGLLAFVVFGLIGMLLIFSPRAGVPVLLVFLAVVGGLRRWLIPLLGYTTTDPLVLVGPALASLFFLNLLATRTLPRDTKLARLQMWLLGFMILEILNPLQGGITVGLAGALFYVVPILWYFLGRRFGSAMLMKRLFQVTVGIALLASLYGLYQTWFGYLPSEMAWMQLSGMGALSVGGTLRAFSFFTSFAEYTWVLCLAIVILWAATLRRNYIAAVPIPLLALAVFLASGRGAVISTLAACVAVWAVQGRTMRSWIPRGVLALVLTVIGLVLSLQQVQQQTFSAQTSNLIAHQTNGLLNPLDAQSSTAGIHSSLILGGVLQGFQKPLGQGLGATTIAASKFDGFARGTEVDFSNMFASLGFLGGFLYLAIVVTVFITAARYWILVRSGVSLAILGILVLMTGQWLTGAQYSTAFLIWFSIGALDNLSRKELGQKNRPDARVTARKPRPRFNSDVPYESI
jgi:hypothetical protein